MKSLLRMSQSAMSRAIQCILISINYYYVYLTELTKDSKNSETRYEKQLKTTLKMWPKNMCIPHLMQQEETPRKGPSTINLHELIKWKHNPKKSGRTLRLTDLELLRSPAKNFK